MAGATGNYKPAKRNRPRTNKFIHYVRILSTYLVFRALLGAFHGVCVKICIKCDNKFSKGNWYKGPTCRQCYLKTYNVENRELIKSFHQKYYRENKDKRQAYFQKWYSENSNLFYQQNREWIRNNPEKNKEYKLKYSKTDAGRKRHSANQRNRQCRKLQAMPAWVDVAEIKLIYLNRPEGHDVDHIIPLKGENVSGLHVPWNLQYLPSYENRCVKRNKVDYQRKAA